MRVYVVDFAGHPFQLDLAEHLSASGHQVVHSYCSSARGPKAEFSRASIDVRRIDLGHEFARYSVGRRLVDEVSFGARVGRVIVSGRPHVVLTSNVPVLSLAVIWLVCVVRRCHWILWLQDFQAGLASVARGRRDWVSTLIGAVETFLARRAEAVVAISPEFRDELQRREVRPSRVTVIENWAPIAELPVVSKVNAWSKRHGLEDRFVFLYSGTMGRKHSNCELLLELSDEFADDAEVVIVVAAEGPGVAQLAERPRANLLLLGLQPFEEVPSMFGSADVLVALLDASAGAFSVPSKVLSYLCAKRPILAAVPRENAAARVITDGAEAGCVVYDGDPRAFRSAARRLYQDPQLREGLGRAGRSYAEHTFDGTRIADRFAKVLRSVRKGG